MDTRWSRISHPVVLMKRNLANCHVPCLLEISCGSIDYVEVVFLVPFTRFTQSVGIRRPFP